MATHGAGGEEAASLGPELTGSWSSVPQGGADALSRLLALPKTGTPCTTLT